MRTNPETMEDLLTLSITALKRLGFVRPGAYVQGPITWNSHDGREIASIAAAVDTRGEIANVRLVYNYNGAPVDWSGPLRFVRSNLDRGGYYLFTCPVTGRNCRKLYLVGGRFVSRFAFRALYEKQTHSRAERTGFYGYINALKDYDDTAQQPRRKTHYRGALTPYGRRLERMAERFQTIGAAYEEKQQERERRRNRAQGKLKDITAIWE